MGSQRALRFGVVILLGAPACFTLDLDGDGTIDLFPPAGYESDHIACSNGLDDDQDGRIDCADADCLMAGFCAEDIPLTPPLGVENTFELCQNRIDDDLDGQFDCGDRDCQGILELCCSGETDNASCEDLVDNDGNGFADCQDFSCRNNPYVTVCEAETVCDNGRDDDGDRLTDCRDPDCADNPVCGERNCSNGRDDDDDGLTDCEDPDCADECPSETNCADGMDDDGDGRTDCDDPDCYSGAPCVGAENTLARCQDGNDNDGNGFTDCNDFLCSRSMDMAIADYCASLSETTLAQCMDGDDNDMNGYTDCDDFSCSMSTDMAAVDYCVRIGENTLERCMDGEDNDGNGFTDCEDFSCSRSSDPAILAHCREFGEATIERCQDRIDNNRNGFPDCLDFSCRFIVVEQTGFCGGTSGCPLGQSCYRGACLRLTSACFESMSLDADTDTQGNEDRMIPTDSTRAERIAMAVRTCTDGVDNDNDGFTDCEDWECNHNPLVVDDEGNPICRFAGGRTCSRGPRAGQSCSVDVDCCPSEMECAEPIGSCGRPGPDGIAFVCPG